MVEMIIGYADGRTVEAALLSFGEDVVRVAVKGAHDSEIFRKIGGRWISEDCEPVVLRFGMLPVRTPVVYRDQDFICSPGLAKQLIGLLASPDDAVDSGFEQPARKARPAVC